MALSAGTVSLGVKADTTDFGRQLHDGIMGGVSGLGKALGVGLLAGAGAAVAAGAAILHTGIGEAMAAAAGTAQLEAGIKSTGGAAGVSADQLNALASSIQDYSGQTDDSIVKSEQLLLTFTNIKNNGPDKIFDQATQASADMAAKMGGDASASAILLGKALNDPAKGITALTRVGVSFTEEQKKSIKAMTDSGDTMGAQKLILKELQTEFGGAAQAAGDSLPGQLEKGKRAFEDMSQAVVTTILPIVTPAISGIAGAIKEVSPKIVEFAKTFIDGVKSIFDLFVKGDFTKTFRETFHLEEDSSAVNFLFNVRDAVLKVVSFIKDTAVPAIQNFIKEFQNSEGAGGKLRAVLEAIGTFISGTLVPAIVNMIKWVGDNKTLVEGFVVSILAGVAAFQAYNAVMAVIKAATIAWTIVQGILNGTLIANPIGLVVMAIAALVAGIIWVATKTTFFQDVWKAAWGWITKTATDAKDWIVEKFTDVVSFVTGLPDKIGRAASGMWDGIKTSFKSAINWVLKAWNDFQFTIGGGNIMGVDIPKITLDTPNIPLLAEGGIVPATPGGRLVRVGEGKYDEAVIPLTNGNGTPNVGSNVTHNWYVTGSSPEALYMQFKRRENAQGAV